MSLGVDNNPAQEGYTKADTINGVPCRKIPTGKFLYAACTRAAIPTSTKNIILSITYFDNSMNYLWVNYTRSGTGWGGADFPKSKTGKWITRLITLTDAGLDGSMGYGGDIRMGFGGEDNYVSNITVYVGTLNPDIQSVPPIINAPNAEFKGKSFAGYQLWHQAGPLPQDWSHWAYGKLPAAGRGNHNIETFPYLADFRDNPNVTLYPTNFINLGNGDVTKLYNSTDKGVIDVQMNLLKRSGFDGVAIQRNAPIGRAIKYTSTDDYYVSIKKACEETGRLFHVMYCMPSASDQNQFPEDIVEGIKRDWVFQMEQIYALTSSTAYATVNGKPVVEIWGLGYSSILVNKTQALALAQFFKSRGCYVIAGVPRDWRLRNEGSRTDFADVYKAYDMVSPWTVGAYGDTTGANNYKNNYMVADKLYCDQNGMDYYPVVHAGGGWSQHVSGYPNDAPRLGGKFLWKQALNCKSIGVTSMYFAMLDEYEESTNIISSAVDFFDIPFDQYFGTQSMDGIWTSPDYYSRLAGTAARMLTDVNTPSEIPIPYSLGPIYYRNSFESRIANCIINGVPQDILTPIDPRFYHDAQLSAKLVTNASATIVNELPYVWNGKYSVKLTGTANGFSDYYYRIAETKIAVKANMQLSFRKYTVNELGRYSSVDLQFKSGKVLRALPAYTDNFGNNMHPATPRGTFGWQKFTCQIGKGELIGDEINAIIIAYDNPNASGDFTAYFDDIIIENAIELNCNATSAIWTGSYNTAWENAANWHCGVLPTASTDVIINEGLINYPVINSYAVCRSITSNAATSVKIITGYSLDVVGH